MPAPKSKRRDKQSQGRISECIAIARREWPTTLLLLLGLPLLWLDLFQPPIAPLVPNLESSWYGALTHFSALGLQYGRDVIFTHGPFGHLVSPVYTGELFFIRMLWELVSKTIFVLILGFTLIQLPKFWRPFLFLFVVLFIRADGPTDALYFLIISCVTFFLFKHGTTSRALNIFAGTFFAIVALIKFTYLLLVVVALILVGAFYCVLRRTSQTILISAAFLVSFIVCWVIAKQELQSLIPYLTTSLDISFGYKDAMSLPAGNNMIVITGAIVVIQGFIQCLLLFFDSRQPAILFAALFIAGETYLSWNRAFIRADNHVLSFFCLHPAVLITLWLIAKPKSTIRWTGYALTLLILFTSLFGFIQQKPGQLVSSVTSAMVRIKSSWRTVTGLSAFSDQFSAALAGARRMHALPKVQAEVRDASIDVLGNEQAMALLNNLNYTPRPVFQGYTAYTPTLINLNTTFYSSPKAPAYVLYKNQTIDDRFPTLDDAGALKQLLYNYKPLFEEKGYLLWKRIQPAASVQPVTTTTESVSLDAEHQIPAAEVAWLELDIKPSFIGKLRSVFYKPPPIMIRVTDALGRLAEDRLVPSMASNGFIISQNLRTSWQALRVTSGATMSPNSSFAIHVSDEARRFFQSVMECRISSLPPLPKSDLDEKAKQLSGEVIFEKQESSQPWLQQLFNSSSEILLQHDSTSGFGSIAPMNRASAARDERGLRITSAGSDPQILFSPTPAGSQGGRLFRVDLIVPVDTTFQVYSVPGGDNFAAVRLLDQPLHQGENSSVYFFLTESQIAAGALVAYTGMPTGDYVITRIEARAVSLEKFQQ